MGLGVTLAGMVFSLFLSISYSDLQSGRIEPMELSESINQVKIIDLISISFNLMTSCAVDFSPLLAS